MIHTNANTRLISPTTVGMFPGSPLISTQWVKSAIEAVTPGMMNTVTGFLIPARMAPYHPFADRQEAVGDKANKHITNL